MRGLLVLAALAGCDQLFDLDRLPDGTGVTGDGAVAGDGQASDAAPCLDDGRDEDGDGLADGCDACPTVVQTPEDDDGDGLPNACDPDLSMTGDRILFAAMFATSTELTEKFTYQNAAHSSTDGAVTLGNSAYLSTKMPVMPTKIELRVSGIYGDGYASETVLRAPPTIACHVHSANCAGTNTAQSCMTTEPVSGESSATQPSSSISKLDMYASGANIVCRAEVAASPLLTAMTPALFGSGTITVQTSPTGSTNVLSIVVYGAI